MTDEAWDDEDRLSEGNARASLRERLPGALLLLVALGWAIGLVWSLINAPRLDLLTAIALGSGPIALILIAGIVFGLTSERRARRLAGRALAMRHEMIRLEAGLDSMAERMSELQERARQTGLGIAEVNDAMSANIDTLGRHSLLLGAAATSAREEMKTLMTDLPRLEERMAQLSRILDDTSKNAELQKGQLVTVLTELSDKANETDQALTPAASRLADQLGRIETLGRGIDPAALAESAERANRTAQNAGAQLARQMTALSDTLARLEARVADATTASRTAEQQGFSRRAALLTDALNSTAIDLTRLLARDIPEEKWAAYLRGERGVFTRTAVRLLGRSEAREVRRLYAEDEEFRAQVVRYIADFEAMLRPLVGSREGEALSVTLLSSDMGKLYVALAQAIERLRA